VGAEVEVLVDSTSRRRDWELAGRTGGNTVVNFSAPRELLGKLVMVRITESGPFSLRGVIAGQVETTKTVGVQRALGGVC
jgi:tRNA-2-methylthio-N6-dimethylallyladenosine synthase